MGNQRIQRDSQGARIIQGKLDHYGEVMAASGGEGKPKLIFMVGCALILHVFAVEHMLASGMDLIDVISRGYLSESYHPT